MRACRVSLFQLQGQGVQCLDKYVRGVAVCFCEQEFVWFGSCQAEFVQTNFIFNGKWDGCVQVGAGPLPLLFAVSLRFGCAVSGRVCSVWTRV
jgi:hypothetical protein